MSIWLILALWIVAFPIALVAALYGFCVWLRKHPYNPQPLVPLVRYAPPSRPRTRHLYKLPPATQRTPGRPTQGATDSHE